VTAEIAGPAARAPAASGAGRPWTTTGRSLARRIAGVVIAVLIWQLVSLTGAIGSQALASATGTAQAIASNAASLADAAVATVEAWAVGIAIAVIAGVLLGTVTGRSHLAEAFTEVLVRMMRPLPSLALIPVAILVAGLGLKMTAGLVAFTAFWPVFINTRYGVRQVDNLVIDTARTLGFRGPGLVCRVILPAAAPLAASGIQVAVSLALVVTVSVELVGGTGGIGSFVLRAQQSDAVSAMYAGIAVGGFIGWVLNAGYGAAVRRLLPWGDRTEVSA